MGSPQIVDVCLAKVWGCYGARPEASGPRLELTYLHPQAWLPMFPSYNNTLCSGYWQDAAVRKLFKRMDTIRNDLLEQQTEIAHDGSDDDDHEMYDDMDGVEAPADAAPDEAAEGAGPAEALAEAPAEAPAEASIAEHAETEPAEASIAEHAETEEPVSVAPTVTEPAVTEDIGKTDIVIVYDPPLHRHRSKGSTASLKTQESMGSLGGSETSNFEMPDMTPEEKQELARVLEQIKLLELQPEAHLKRLQCCMSGYCF